MSEQTQEDIGKGLPADFVKTVRDAESPFREAVKKYQDGLTPEGKAALEKIAHEEGKAAVEAYKQSKSLEDPKIEALRNLSAETVQLNPDTKKMIKDSDRYPFPKIEELAKKVGMGEVDKLIADGNISNERKIAGINDLGYYLNTGIRFGLIKTFGPKEAANQNGFSPDEISTTAPYYKDRAKNFLLGMFVGSIATNGDAIAVQALSEMASWDENKKSADFIEEYKPYINEARKNSGDQSRDFDESMQRENFLWSPGRQDYINMGQETKK